MSKVEIIDKIRELNEIRDADLYFNSIERGDKYDIEYCEKIAALEKQLINA